MPPIDICGKAKARSDQGRTGKRRRGRPKATAPEDSSIGYFFSGSIFSVVLLTADGVM